MVLCFLLSDEDAAKLRHLAEEIHKTDPERRPASVEAAARVALQMGVKQFSQLLKPEPTFAEQLENLFKPGSN